MNRPKKWLVILLATVLIGALFADKFITFYIDLLWFSQYNFLSVIITVLGAQFSFGFLFGGLFFLFTWGILSRIYGKTSHLPVVLSEEARRDMPLLDLIASNLKPLTILVPLALAVLTGLAAAQKWDVILKFMNHVPFNQVDPIFGNDYGFYLFTLPFITLVKNILWTGLIVIFLGTGGIYFFKRFIYLTPSGFELHPEARRSMSLGAAALFVMAAAEFFLRRYGLLFNGTGVVAGVGFADDYGRIPILNALVAISMGGAVVCLLNFNQPGLRRIFISAGVVGAVYLASNLYPAILTKFVVDPNELIKETPYIEYTIAGTNLAFGLQDVEEKKLTGAATLDASVIAKNSATIENIRLWDEGPLLDTLGQIQEIRTYYQFASVDNDRYWIDGKYQQTLLSPRELHSPSLPNRTWINEHLTFTHGYGVSLSPVNRITPEGLPVLLIKDIPPKSSVDLQVTRPELYYGELSNDHVFVNTDTMEFDYPEGENNVYKNYSGEGGIQVSSFFRKLLFAARFKTVKIIFSQDIHNDSRVLMYRNIRERVEKVAPFLRLDNDPYLVITDSGRLVWLFDAYTTSDQFPYSLRLPQIGNYIRNSVKISIDAYDGVMNFYIADPSDPIIMTYRKLFPDMFKDIAEMPEGLREHIRYPQDLFSIQTFIYATYHMKTAQVFYNKEDQWEIPTIDGVAMQPYYTIMKLPNMDKEEYILMLPFTPQGKQNMSAWMVARSDGEHYGKIAVYAFPKQKLVYGPSQIVARINQDSEISRQISLWDQRGSSVIQGNLLVIPIEESLIYVRPLYLKADAGKMPELKRVIVGYEDQIAMESTLEKALTKIFGDISGSRSPTEEFDAAQGAPGKPRHVSMKDKGGKVSLSQADFLKIRDYYERAVKSQALVDLALQNYSGDLQKIGKLLDTAVVTPAPEKQAPPNTGENGG